MASNDDRRGGRDGLGDRRKRWRRSDRNLQPTPFCSRSPAIRHTRGAPRPSAARIGRPAMRKSNFALRLQPSIFNELRAVAAADEATLNQFINIAIAEKLAVLRTEEYFRERA